MRSTWGRAMTCITAMTSQVTVGSKALGSQTSTQGSTELRNWRRVRSERSPCRPLFSVASRRLGAVIAAASLFSTRAVEGHRVDRLRAWAPTRSRTPASAAPSAPRSPSAFAHLERERYRRALLRRRQQRQRGRIQRRRWRHPAGVPRGPRQGWAPIGEPLASAELHPQIRTISFPFVRFGKPPRVVAGRSYDIVFTNTSPQPSRIGCRSTP